MTAWRTSRQNLTVRQTYDSSSPDTVNEIICSDALKESRQVENCVDRHAKCIEDYPVEVWAPTARDSSAEAFREVGWYTYNFICN